MSCCSLLVKKSIERSKLNKTSLELKLKFTVKLTLTLHFTISFAAL